MHWQVIIERLSLLSCKTAQHGNLNEFVHFFFTKVPQPQALKWREPQRRYWHQGLRGLGPAKHLSWSIGDGGDICRQTCAAGNSKVWSLFKKNVFFGRIFVFCQGRSSINCPQWSGRYLPLTRPLDVSFWQLGNPISSKNSRCKWLIF